MFLIYVVHNVRTVNERDVYKPINIRIKFPVGLFIVIGLINFLRYQLKQQDFTMFLTDSQLGLSQVLGWYWYNELVRKINRTNGRRTFLQTKRRGTPTILRLL